MPPVRQNRSSTRPGPIQKRQITLSTPPSPPAAAVATDGGVFRAEDVPIETRIKRALEAVTAG